MFSELTCWKCGSQLSGVIFPMSRREECSSCNADQHVCKMCKEFDGRGACNEPNAEDVSNRETANFCAYFSPSERAHKAFVKQKSQDAKAKFNALFGDEAVVNPTEQAEEGLSPAELAERRLRTMLGD